MNLMMKIQLYKQDPDNNENDISQRELQNGDLLLFAEDFGQGKSHFHIMERAAWSQT